ncbi:MAG: NAD(P)/FAD-dependent oxidoreductase [Armatimonadota bacterium]
MRARRAPLVIVVGGGPAGLTAAGRAAECGASVVLLERNPRPGVKLRISGKGRGNITNTADIDEFVEAFSPNGRFLYGVFSRFFRDDLLDLLGRLGVETKVERGGRIFPASDRAGDVADALERWVASNGVRIRTGTRAKSVVVEDGRVTGVNIYGGQMGCDALVIATGGASYPRTGSTGDGYAMARELGHTIVSPRPALSALVCREEWIKDLQGLSLRNVEARLCFREAAPNEGLIASASLRGEEPGPEQTEQKPARARVIAREFGEMLITHFGVSGPIILTLSRGVGELIERGVVTISIDLKPGLSAEQLHARLIRDFTQTSHVKNYLKSLLPRLLIDVFVELAGLDPNKPVNTVTAQERGRIVELLKGLEVTVAGTAPLNDAIVTAGGVSIKEIDPRTMMSKLVPGLFFAGEVIDIDARTGGFNLQAAFSTGWVAGEAAAKYADRICRAGGE